MERDAEMQDCTREKYDLIISRMKPIIREDLEPVIADLPDDKKEQILGVITSRIESSFSSPVPPPHMLKDYNEAIPSGAERLMQMAEKQLAHRLEIETRLTGARIRETLRGQLFGLSVAIVGLVLATLLALYNHETLGGIFGTTTIIGLVTIFVLERKQNSTT